MLSPSFNREAIRHGEPLISQCVVKFLDKLNLHAQTGRPVNMRKAFQCLLADAVMKFAYQEDFGALEAEDFDSELLVPICDFTQMMQWPIYFPGLCKTIFKMTEMLPNWAIEKWFKGIVTQNECLQVSLFLLS